MYGSLPPNSTRLARFCRHFATIIREREALCDGVSAIRPKLRGLRIAGQRRRRKMKPDTTRVRTSRSCGQRDITFFCKQLQMYRRVLQKIYKHKLELVNLESQRTPFRYFGHASADIKIDSLISSRMTRRNSALVQASPPGSILEGFN